MKRRNAAGEGTDQKFVHARTTLTLCSVPAPCGVTFLAPPAFQFSPAVRFVRSDLSDRRSRRGYRTRTGRRPRWRTSGARPAVSRPRPWRVNGLFHEFGVAFRVCGEIRARFPKFVDGWPCGKDFNLCSRPRRATAARPPMAPAKSGATADLAGQSDVLSSLACGQLRAKRLRPFVPPGPQPSLVRALTGRPMLRRTTSMTSSV